MPQLFKIHQIGLGSAFKATNSCHSIAIGAIGVMGVMRGCSRGLRRWLIPLTLGAGAHAEWR